MANKSVFASVAGRLLPKASASNAHGAPAYAYDDAHALAQVAITGTFGVRDAATGLTLIPLNMNQPVLVVRGKDAKQGLDVRFHAGGVDASELPSSYKNADAVVAQIKSYGLAEIVDYIDPYGCIMAGDVPPFWQKKKR
jgi:hypothetical protein